MAKEQDAQNNKIGVIAAIVVLVAVVATITAVSILGNRGDGSYTLDIKKGEQVAVAEVRLAVVQEQLDGTGEIKQASCVKLGEIAREFNSKADWFSRCSYFLYGNAPDTDSAKILELSDGDYCAKFTFNKDITRLTAYGFVSGNCAKSGQIDIVQ